jgi:DNA-directed RNA polymerase I subunit RPA43
MAPLYCSWVSSLLYPTQRLLCALNAFSLSHSLTVANQMLSLVGSVQPDPFSPEHVPQAKPDREAQGPQPSPRLPSEATGSEGMEDELEETMVTREEEEEESLATRGKKKREKEKGKVGKAKRKRKEDIAVTKSERKPKRKKTS